MNDAPSQCRYCLRLEVQPDRLCRKCGAWNSPLVPTRKKASVAVSDHAVLRYLERVGRFDIPALREGIAARVQYAAELGAAAVKIDGHAYVIQDGVVTTVLPEHHAGPVVRARQ